MFDAPTSIKTEHSTDAAEQAFGTLMNFVKGYLEEGQPPSGAQMNFCPARMVNGPRCRQTGYHGPPPLSVQGRDLKFAEFVINESLPVRDQPSARKRDRFVPMSTVLVWSIRSGRHRGRSIPAETWPEAVWACLGAVLLVIFWINPSASRVERRRQGTGVYLFLTGMMLLPNWRQKGVSTGLPPWQWALPTVRGTRLFSLVISLVSPSPSFYPMMQPLWCLLRRFTPP